MGFFSSIPTVSVTEAAEKVGKSDAVFVDVRMPEEYAHGHARGAENCPLPSLSKCFDKLKKYSTVYVICQSGGRSSAAVSALLGQQINALNVSGGTSSWRAHGLPIV